jgi:uncharacterized membrane protein
MNKWYIMSIVFAVLAVASFILDFYVNWSDWYFYFYYQGITEIGMYFLAAILAFAILAVATFSMGFFVNRKTKKSQPQSL